MATVGETWDWNKPANPVIMTGHGDPNTRAVVVAPPGTIYVNLDSYLPGNTEHLFFVKESGNGSTGWHSMIEG